MERIHSFGSWMRGAIPKQFTLRGLLVLMLVIGLGLWWWRQPFVVREDRDVLALVPQGLGVGIIPAYEMGSFRRTSPGVITQDGVTKVFDEFDQCIAVESWQNGVLHGPVRRYYAHGYLYETGQYRDGRPDGTWISQTPLSFRMGLIPPYYERKVNPQNRQIVADYAAGERTRTVFKPLPTETQYCVITYGPQSTSTRSMLSVEGKSLEEVAYENGRRHGSAQGWHNNGRQRYTGQWQTGQAKGEWTFWNDAGGVEEELEFTDGRLVKRGGQPLAGYPDLLPYVGAIDPDGTQQLQTPLHLGGAAFDEDVPWRNQQFKLTRSREKLETLARQIDAQLDTTVPPETCRTLEVHFPYDGLPADAALYLALHRHGLVMEHRDEQFWITTVAAAKNWNRGPSLQLTATPQSNLANQLTRYTEFDFSGHRLHDLAFQLEKDRHIRVNLETAAGAAEKLEDRPIRLHVQKVSLQAALATLCYFNDLACEVRNDELVIKARSQATGN